MPPRSRATCENVQSQASTRRTASFLNSSLKVLFRVSMTPHLPGIRRPVKVSGETVQPQDRLRDMVSFSSSP